ncbi:unnamed protein product [Ostreobium quekettii]|uniref:WDR90 4th beta-propeller domain-containing protein n=1 Tax=Ostreobium quekettii TaxID=121088 RepID=A0A8S1ITD6_9CHLO|nr:unnamed protein product [Ostreobium quekettii]
MQFDAATREGIVSTDTARVWYLTLPNKPEVPLVSGHPGPITALCSASNDSQALASVAADGALRLWHLHKATLTVEFHPVERCTCCDISPSGECIAAGCEDGTLRIFDVLQPGAKWSAVRHGCSIIGVIFSADGQKLASLSSNGNVAISETETSRIVRSDEAGSSNLVSMSATSDGRTCAAAWASGLVVFSMPWDDPGGNPRATYVCGQGGDCQDASACVAFSPAYPHAVLFSTALIPGRVVCFDYRQNKVVRHVDLPGGVVASLGASPNGVWFAAGSQSGAVFLVDCASQQWKELGGHRQRVAAVQFCACNTKLVTAGGAVMMVRRLGEGW